MYFKPDNLLAKFNEFLADDDRVSVELDIGPGWAVRFKKAVVQGRAYLKYYRSVGYQRSKREYTHRAATQDIEGIRAALTEINGHLTNISATEWPGNEVA